jgi:mono/diheme cytochrome c family protein
MDSLRISGVRHTEPFCASARAAPKVALRGAFLRLRHLALVAAALCLLATSFDAHQPVTAVTWSDDIAAIVEARCLQCHGPAGGASPRLDSYANAHEAAPRIKREVLEHRMPPWPAARGFGSFANDRSLSPLETELLLAWASGGAPRGDRDDSLVRRDVAAAHHRTPPSDLVLVVPAGKDVREASRTIDVATGRMTDVWIDAWTFRPGNPVIVEQAEVSIVGGDPIGAWVPSDGWIQFPSGIAQRLPAGARIRLRIYYKKASGSAPDHSSVAFSFTARPKRVLRHRWLSCGPATLSESIAALAIRPTVARAGASVEALARQPDGRIDALVWVPDYRLRFEPAYWFREPVMLPRGTHVEVNSPAATCGADLAYVLQ